MVARAWIGFLAGYEGDNGHCFSQLQPANQEDDGA
jgi:hypothetical protein